MKKYNYYVVCEGEGVEKSGFFYKENIFQAAEELINFLKERNLKAVKIELKEITEEK